MTLETVLGADGVCYSVSDVFATLSFVLIVKGITIRPFVVLRSITLRLPVHMLIDIWVRFRTVVKKAAAMNIRIFV